MSKIVNCFPQDSVRIEYPHKGLTIPASMVFEVDQNLKTVREDGNALIVYKANKEEWIAECGGAFYGIGYSPIQAIANMVRK